jgi:aryl-alcohol dehydrogenase-like predicted oxidoreductase
LGVISYYSLAAGFLTGKYRSEQDLSKSVRGHRAVHKYLTERGRRILAALDMVAATSKATVAQVALAWLVHRPTVSAPIVSATTLDQLRELLLAPQLHLSPSDLGVLDEASSDLPQHTS